jgi:hypothetical protein
MASIATHPTVILRSRALARRLEGWPQVLVADPSRLAARCGEHLRMTSRYAVSEIVSWDTIFGESESRWARSIN